MDQIRILSSARISKKGELAALKRLNVLSHTKHKYAWRSPAPAMFTKCYRNQLISNNAIPLRRRRLSKTQTSPSFVSAQRVALVAPRYFRPRRRRRTLQTSQPSKSGRELERKNREKPAVVA